MSPAYSMIAMRCCACLFPASACLRTSSAPSSFGSMSSHSPAPRAMMLLLCSARLWPFSAASIVHADALAGSRGSPTPCWDMTPRLYCAFTWPSFAAHVNHRPACRGSCLSPLPLRNMTPTAYCASRCPFLAACRKHSAAFASSGSVPLPLRNLTPWLYCCRARWSAVCCSTLRLSSEPRGCVATSLANSVSCSVTSSGDNGTANPDDADSSPSLHHAPVCASMRNVSGCKFKSKSLLTTAFDGGSSD
mmetsp:Transcript_31206/g.89444  ORF Transcript_31206/g.89444 Transcript_31206/m.89444 type:complete len:248 (+) Transcript_31206:539-1282(+)